MVAVNTHVAAGDDLSASAAVVVTELDVVEPGVKEVDPPDGQVESEAARQVQLVGDDGGTEAAVHASTLNARMLAPVRPEHHPHTVTHHA